MQSRSRIDWDDLRYFVAVARHGSTIAAGRALGVDPSTVQRRMSALERAIGRPLIERTPTGYRLTELGTTLAPYADAVDAAVVEFEQRLRDADRDTVGIVRVTCPEPIVYRITQSTLLERFHAKHPGIRIEFVMSDRYLDLTKGDADVALRSGDTDADLIGRRIADSLWAVYASRAYVERHGQPARVESLREHALIGFDESMAEHRASKWLAQVAPDARVVARNDSVLGLLYAVKSGLGVAPLPTALGDADAELVRVLGPIPELTRVWRLLTTRALRRTPRVAAFFDFIADEGDALRPILTG